jgi:3-dehydroshikimate dehydratase
VIYLSAFADEISADLDEQMQVLLSEGIHFIDLRSVWGTNVVALSDEQLREIKRQLDAHGMGVAAIGSPIGKIPIDSSFEEHLQLFERAIQAAHLLNTTYIRIFSFYPPIDRQRCQNSLPNRRKYPDFVCNFWLPRHPLSAVTADETRAKRLR